MSKTAIYGTLYSLLFLCTVQAAPVTLNYQGRILTSSDGKGLEYSAVSFEFTVLNPAGTCIIYREQVSGIDMRNSKGLFDVVVGSGTKTYPAAPSFNLQNAFSNFDPITCDGGVIYNPVVTDGRLLRVQFYDGNGWRLISPDSVIRSVPYSSFASQALKLESYSASDFVLRSSVNSNTSCSGGSFLTWDSGTKTFGCAAAPGGGGGGISDLTGDVTASGSGSVAASIANNAVTSAKINDGSVVGGDMDFTGTNAATTEFVMKDSTGKFYEFACSTVGHVPTWSAGGFSCQTPSITESDPQVGANTTNYLSKWDGSALVATGVFEDGAGKVGIGTATPQVSLHVVSSSSGAGVRFENTSNYGPRFMLRASGSGGHEYSMSSTASGNSVGAGRFMIADETAVAARLVIDSAGNVGIGTDSPSAELDVVGDIQYTGVLTDVSDRRLKKNITPLLRASEKIRKMKVFSYVMKDDPKEKTEFGLMAQDLQDILPELVSPIGNGYYGVNYIGLIPWLVRANQELDHKVQTQIKNLLMENQELRERLERQEMAQRELAAAMEKLLKEKHP